MEAFAVRVGERIRAIRMQKGLSLHEVEAASGKEFKASVLGAYERGERTISVPRLSRLAEIYDVPVDVLLPTPNGQARDGSAGAQIEGAVCINLVRLGEVRLPETELIARYVRAIQNARGDFNGRMLTVRSDDIRALSAVMEMTPETFAGRLDELGLRVEQQA